MSDINPLNIPDEDMDDFLSADTEVEAELNDTTFADEQEKEEIVEDIPNTSVEEEENTEQDDENAEDTPKEEIEEGSTEKEDESTPSKEDLQDEEELDYESLKKVLEPFKANGKEMQVDSAEDAITLMQMGANYKKKMDSISPLMKFSKMLEKNDLLDESKLSYLIDLHNKNPEAIKKLIKDSELDPLDLELEDAEEDTYTPNDYSVSDKEVQFDNVIEELRHTDTFDKTVDVLVNQMDQASKDAILESPDLLRTLNEHMSDGTYTYINDLVQKERMFNRIPLGYSDLEAYDYIGNLIAEQSNAAAVEKTSNVSKVQKEENNANLLKRKQAASSTKTDISEGKIQESNPLHLSDEEFLKLMN